MKKRIGITCSEELQNDKYIHFIKQDYLQAIIAAQGIPVLLPPVPIEDIEMQLDMIDGLMIIGGCDVNPLLYHENPLPLLGETDYPRDLYEIALIKKATQKKYTYFRCMSRTSSNQCSFWWNTLSRFILCSTENTFTFSKRKKRMCKSYNKHSRK